MEQNKKLVFYIIFAVLFVLVVAAILWQWPSESDGIKVERNAEFITPAATSLPLAPSKPQGESKFRVYDMKINKDGFSIPKITVNNGDTVQFNLTAEDAKYDFGINYFGFYAVIPNNQTKVVSIDLDRGPGKFEFACVSFCPSSGKITGQLEVLE